MPNVSRRSQSSCSTTGFRERRGLLTNVHPVAIGKDYSRQINLKDAANLLSDTGRTYQTALQLVDGNEDLCTDMLERVTTKANSSLKDVDSFNDVDVELKRVVNNVICDIGQFCMYTRR